MSDDYTFEVEDEMLIELGRLLYSAAYLEEALHLVFDVLVGDRMVGETLVARQPMNWVLERSRWLCRVQLGPGSPTEAATLDWLDRVDAVQRRRNRVVHASWYVDATVMIGAPDQSSMSHGLRRFRRPKQGQSVEYDEELVAPLDIRAIALECEAAGLAGLAIGRRITAWYDHP